jgi:HTH-type transcriptional regulator/antitoxin HipB
LLAFGLGIYLPSGNETAILYWNGTALSRSGKELGLAMAKIETPVDIGRLVRKRRKGAGLTLQEAAGMAGVGIRFLSELERGKPTLQLGLVLQVLQLFGLELHVHARGDSA